MSTPDSDSTRQRPLRPGDVVEVKSPAEILATLDGDGVNHMPFMPEMLGHTGRRYTVSRRADKICDMVESTGSRRLYDTVYLDDLRCDGSAHGGCQAGCKLYWKEDWLRLVEPDGSLAVVPASEPSPELEALAQAGTRTLRDGDADEVWRCQATEALKASEHLKVFKNPGQYWREFTNGNFRRVRFVRLFIRALAMEVWKRLGRLPDLPLHGPGPEAPDYEPLDLQPGELVRVRSPEEIQATLDNTGFNRRLSFDREMLRYCGQTLRVKARVNRIVDESSGRMLRINKDCIILEGSVCSGECSTGRWFCGREIYAYWREAWLQRVEDPESANGSVEALRVERVG